MAKKQRAKTPLPVPAEADAYSVEGFCRRHSISLQLFYKFPHEMPRTFNIGKRRLISKEAAAEWRRQREAVTAAEPAQAAA